MGAPALVDVNQDSTSRPTSASGIPARSHSPTPKKSRTTSSILNKAESVLSVIGQRISSSNKDDEFDLLGKSIAVKLRKLSTSRMQVMAEKLIHEVLYEAQLGTLTENTKLSKGESERQASFPTYQVFPVVGASGFQETGAVSSQPGYSYGGVGTISPTSLE